MVTDVLEYVTIGIQRVNNFAANIIINYKANVFDSSKTTKLTESNLKSPASLSSIPPSIRPRKPRFQIPRQNSQRIADAEEQDAPEYVKEERQVKIGGVGGGCRSDRLL